MDEIWNLSHFRQYKPTVQISLHYKIWARQRFVDFGWIDPAIETIIEKHVEPIVHMTKLG